MSYLRPRFFLVMMVGLFFTELAWAQDLPRQAAASPNFRTHVEAPGASAWQYSSPPSHIYLYTYPPVMTVPVIPKAYLDKSAREMQESNWHFYCRHSQVYFPYVKDCPEGWEVVNLEPDLR